MDGKANQLFFCVIIRCVSSWSRESISFFLIIVRMSVLCLAVLETAHYESDAVVNYLIAFHVLYGVIFLLTVVEKAGEM